LPARFVFTGKGYGHGVGMSQWGAQGMALGGRSAEEILKHYYLGIEITTLGGA
jgi:stage II sporulation protein D